VTALRTGLIVAVLVAGAMVLTAALGIPLMLTSWASSAALIAALRTSPAARPAAVGLGHLMSGAVGYAMLMLVQHLGIEASLLAPLSAGAAVMAMMGARHFHPPAAANAAIPLFTAVAPAQFALACAAGAVALAALAATLDRIDGAKS
jgi:CBS-domain-containing membrane protein